jgi:hypothetical protein
MEFRGIKPIEDVAPLAALATQIDMHVECCGTQYVVTGMAGGDQRVLLSMLGGIMAALVASTPDEHKGDLVNKLHGLVPMLEAQANGRYKD